MAGPPRCEVAAARFYEVVKVQISSEEESIAGNGPSGKELESGGTHHFPIG